MPHVAVILSGSGVFDGSEITEAVSTLLALDRRDCTWQCLAPDKDQLHVINHVTGEPVPDQTRNCLIEAARIARGQVVPVAEADVAGFDAVILPGGFGAAKNLCTFAVDGADCQVDADVARFLEAAHAAGKPIAALCIAPAVIAKVFGASLAPTVTIGNDPGAAQGIEALGAKHEQQPITGISVDQANKIVTAPCYMYGDARVSQIADNADAAVHACLELVGA